MRVYNTTPLVLTPDQVREVLRKHNGDHEDCYDPDAPIYDAARCDDVASMLVASDLTASHYFWVTTKYCVDSGVPQIAVDVAIPGIPGRFLGENLYDGRDFVATGSSDVTIAQAIIRHVNDAIAIMTGMGIVGPADEPTTRESLDTPDIEAARAALTLRAAPVPQPGSGQYRALFLLELLTTDRQIAGADLDTIADEVIHGGSSGDLIHLNTTEVTRRSMSALLAGQGCDPDFLTVGFDPDCAICGEPFWRDENEVAHHAGNTPDGVDHDADADHVPYDQGQDGEGATAPGPGSAPLAAAGQAVVADGGA